MTSSEEREKQIADLGWQVRVLAGREISFDSEGFFREARDWSEEIALVLARESGMEDLTETHWKVLRFFREYYFYHGRTPMNRHLRQGTGMSLGELESLFPGGIRLGARRLAGLPNPQTC
jgi:dissimilatory sulfite reductase related protein